MVKKIALVLIVSILSVSHANFAPQDLSPEQLMRYQTLLKELRCLVCQNQSLADSNAELAGDLRTVVLKMVRANTPDKEIYMFLTDRYGDFVRYRPPLKLTTALLWFAPFLTLFAILSGVFLYLRRFNRDSK